jgi:hypothetical protein
MASQFCAETTAPQKHGQIPNDLIPGDSANHARQQVLQHFTIVRDQHRGACKSIQNSIGSEVISANHSSVIEQLQHTAGVNFLPHRRTGKTAGQNGMVPIALQAAYTHSGWSENQTLAACNA